MMTDRHAAHSTLTALLRPRRRPSLCFVLFCVLLAFLWLAGGASRADVFGQVVVRLAAVGVLILLLLFGNRPTMTVRAPGWLLAGAICLAVIQLVPMPPSVWQLLPGRSFFAEAMLGRPQPWRPLTLAPAATINALAALIVPLAMLAVLTTLPQEERSQVPAAILIMIVASNLLGLVQFSGTGFNNPLINGTVGDISSSFANRNHFALLLALGCLLVPVWIGGGYWSRGRAVIGLATVLLFLLTILATGSRAGLLLGALALVSGLVMVQGRIRHRLRRAPLWAFPALIGIFGVLVAGLVLVSMLADRAVSIQRIFNIDAGQDMRRRALPTVWAMTREYFPIGAGLGSFDPLFRLHEPLSLLKPTFFNHAHDDFLEIALDAGLPGVSLLLAALIWWGWASVRAWQPGAPMLPRIGSAWIFLIAMASAFDYPARTPMVMALIIVAAVWLGGGGRQNPA